MILEGKTILVTGGTGSLGKVLVRRMLSGEQGTPRKVIVFSRDEAKQHDMRLAYLNRTVTTDEVIYRNFMQTLEFRIGDVRDYPGVCAAVRDCDIVVNAAALKQVPSCEYFPVEAMLTNCQGASNIVRAIGEHKYAVETVVAISTDKACKPVNVMGITKALQERIFVAANVLNPRTRFIGVRYGNVLASRGSVIPLFHAQIAAGGPITITSPDMTRFLLSLDRAVDTIFAALGSANAGEIYVPIVPSATVINVARALIGDASIETRIIGVRPGEKMHEIMISEEEIYHCERRGDWYAIRSMLPELSSDTLQSPALQREYSSADFPLDFEDTVVLLRENRLLPTDVLREGGELLR
jgi:UDP-glucose 4-epimerase